MPGAQVGPDCVLGQNVMVGPGVRIGRGVKVQNNVSIYAGVTLEDDVFCGPSCVFTNVLTPRAFCRSQGRISAYYRAAAAPRSEPMRPSSAESRLASTPR